MTSTCLAQTICRVEKHLTHSGVMEVDMIQGPYSIHAFLHTPLLDH